MRFELCRNKHIISSDDVSTKWNKQLPLEALETNDIIESITGRFRRNTNGYRKAKPVTLEDLECNSSHWEV